MKSELKREWTVALRKRWDENYTILMTLFLSCNSISGQIGPLRSGLLKQ